MIDNFAAKTIAAEYLKAMTYSSEGDKLVLDEQETREKEYGWIFFYCSSRYLETGDERYLLGGNAPFLVKRADGSVFSFGTNTSIDWFLEGYEAGFQVHAGSLTITHVSDRNQAALFLNRLQLSYVIPEFAYGVEWRIPKLFTLRQIQKSLQSLPVTFHDVGVLSNYETFLQMNASGCCRYRIEPRVTHDPVIHHRIK